MIAPVKLFLNHASEDKDFVRQLYDRLVAEGFEVWLDERSLKLGDSLLGKINEGLLASDYGVVVLSPTFFGKKWTRAELAALMALETTTKKMILPIWKNLSAAEITELMPTLADRVAVNADAGLDVVVQAIKSAVGGAEHQRTLSRFDQLKGRIAKMSAASKARRDADTLLNSVDGARRVRAEINRLGEVLVSYCSALSSDEFKFIATKIREDTFNVQGPRRYAIEVHFAEGAYNTASAAKLRCIIYRLGQPKYFGERTEPRELKHLKFFPYFDGAGAAIWSPTEKREEMLTTEEVLAQLVEKLTDYADRES